MPVTTLAAANTAKRKRGGGNKILFKQLLRNADGTFGVLTGTDCLGDTAGSYHVLGSNEDSGWGRDDKGRWSLDATVIEMDVAHRNLASMVAPITAQSLIKDPDLTLEDGTQVINAEVSGNVTFPYFEFWYLDAPIGGKAQARVMVGQFEATDSWTNKITEWSKHKLKIVSVDALGYVVPAIPTDTSFSTFSAPTLAVPYQHGKDIEGT